MDRRAASPGPQGHQMQRPRTMYDGDFQNMGQYGVDGMNRGHQQQHNTSMIQHQRSQSASPMKVRQGNVDDRYGPSSGFGGGRSASPNPMMMNNGRSPSPNPMTMSRGRSPSPNPMMMNRGISRSPSPNPMMMRGRSNSQILKDMEAYQLLNLRDTHVQAAGWVVLATEQSLLVLE